MKFLVTGGCGFIGAHLSANLVENGHEVTILDDLSTGKASAAPVAATLIEGCITDSSVVARAMDGVEGVFHLAAIASVERCMQEWEYSQRVNLGGAIAIFNAARTRKTPVVYASSAAVYGANDNLPLSETSEALPISTYGQDKLSCEHYAKLAWDLHGVPNVGLRFFNVYGVGQQPDSPYSGVITKFMECIAAKQPLYIYGDGEQVRDFIHVSDIVALLGAAMAHEDKKHEVFNGCTGQAVNIKTLAEQMVEEGGCAVAIEYKEARAGDIRFSYGSPEKSESILKVKAQCSLKEGVASLLQSISQEAA